MNDISKLPKWVQKHIKELQQSQHMIGANIEDVSIEVTGFKHNEESSAAIVAIASAMAEHSKALNTLANTIVPKNCAANIEQGISLNNVTAKP